MTNRDKGLEFEKQCYAKLADLNFTDLQLTPNTDNGADIVGTLNGTRYVFQCKNHKRTQGNRCVQEVIAAQSLYRGNRCVVISHSPFTDSAIALAKANNCILIQVSDFLELTEFPPKGYTNIFEKSSLKYNFDYTLIESYEEQKKKIGRTPKWSELDKSLRYYITRDYKNYGNFLSSIGDMKYTNKHTAEELKNEYIRIKQKIGKVPTGADIKANSTFSYNQFHEYPLTKLQRECGDRPNVERGVSKEELVYAYFDLEKKLGHPPAIREINEKGKYRTSYYERRWGSFNEFLATIGRTRTEAGLRRIYTKDEIVLIYSLVKILLSVVHENNNYKVNKKTLEKLCYDDKCLISPSTCTNPSQFGSWGNFMQHLKREAIDVSLEKIIDVIREDGFNALLEILKK